jgi:hypothetical protein
MDVYLNSAKTGVNPHNGENSPWVHRAREILSYTLIVFLQRNRTNDPHQQHREATVTDDSKPVAFNIRRVLTPMGLPYTRSVAVSPPHSYIEPLHFHVDLFRNGEGFKQGLKPVNVDIYEIACCEASVRCSLLA